MVVLPPVRRRLRARGPLWPDSLFGHLAATAVPGVEEWRDGSYRRTVRLAHGPAIIALRPGAAYVGCTLWLTDEADAGEAVQLCRFLLDLDADLDVVDADLARDAVLAPLVAAAPGRRIPRTVDADELAVRAVLGQQVSTAAARTHAARLVQAYGVPVVDPAGGLTHLFPDADALAGLDVDALAMPRTRRATLVGLVTALAEGTVRLDADPADVRQRLGALPGIGPWTLDTVLMRALGDSDTFLVGDLGVRAAADRLGLPTAPRALSEYSRRWSPWRAYAVQHLWATGEHAVNRLPSRS